MLIRLPPEELRQAAQVDGYSAAAVAFWRSNPGKSVDDLVTFVSGRAGALLIRNGVPQPDVLRGSVAKGTSTLALFDAKAWAITVDVNALATASPQSGVTPATRMAGLTIDAVAELSQACYHEARHAEQSFLAARLAAEEATSSIDPDRLSRRMGIKFEIAEAAIWASGTVLPDVLKTKANAWRTFMRGGRQVPYKIWNDRLQNQLAIFKFVYSAKIDEWVKLGPGQIQLIWQQGLREPFDKTFRRDLSFRGDALLREINASPHKDPVDVEVKQALTKTAYKLFMMLVKEGEARKLSDIDAVAKMGADEADSAKRDAQIWLLELKIALLDAKTAADEAYRAYPNEADAYETGTAVKASVVSQGGSGP